MPFIPDEPSTGRFVPDERRVAEPAGPSGTNARIMQEAMYKGVAALPDMVLNAPNNLLNLGRAAVGTAATAMGRSDLAPELTPNPDLARRGLESAGLIDPNIKPEGGLQKGIDLITQGVTGGALTGGASIPRAIAGAGMGALSAGAGGVTEAAGGSPAAIATASMLAPGAAGKVMSSRGTNLNPNQALLANENVSLTPGQIKGGTVKRIEDAATSFPVLGDSIKAAQRRGVETFDAAAINRSLAPIGERLPLGLKGNKAIEFAYNKLGDAYEGLLPNLKGDLNAGGPSGTTALAVRTPNALATPGQGGSFKQELDNIKAMGQNLPEAQRSQLNAIIDKEVIGQFTSSGLASGETLKNIESLLGSLAKKKALSDNYHENQLGGALKEVQAAMRRMVNNVNPEYEGQLTKINEGYANFKRVQNAATRPGAQEGVFTPTQLQQSVRAGDKSKDKARFAEGRALMQDLSQAGKSVLPSTVPDSGTPLRAMLGYALAHPFKAVGLGIPTSLASLAYTPSGQRTLQAIMTRQGNPMYADVANQISPITTGTTLADLQRQQR